MSKSLTHASDVCPIVVDVGFESGADLGCLLARLAWALLPVENVKVRMWNAEKPGKIELPSEFDPEIQLESLLEITEWSEGVLKGLVSGELRITGSDRKVIRDSVVWKGESSREGSEFSQLAFYMRSGEVDTMRRECERKFQCWSRDWRGCFERSTVLATGPSFDWYTRLDTAGDFVVTCNSSIINTEMMERINPQVVVFADPIFHFGPSLYAGNFRNELMRAAERHEFKIFIPEIYAFNFLAALPDLAERTYFVPFSQSRSTFNLDLRAQWETKVTKNILTFLMLPLAATFAKTIRILGCDGRSLSESSYFWGHNKSAQINDKMTNIQKVHPGFFSIDYNDYYLEHCRLLECMLSQAENEGRRIHSVAPSKIPALASRAVSSDLREMVDRETETALGCSAIRVEECEGLKGIDSIHFVSVNPSLRSRMGHAIHQDASMKAEVELQGGNFASLAHIELIPELQGDFALPVFSVKTVDLAKASESVQRELASRFVDELFSGLEVLQGIADLDEATVFLYLGHSALLAPIASRLSTGRFRIGKIVVNLFSGYFGSVLSSAHQEELVSTALRVQAVNDLDNLVVVCDSERFGEAIWKISGLLLTCLPMAQSQEISASGDSREDGPIRIVFPSHAEEVRGFHILREFASNKARQFDGAFEFIFRQFAPWNKSMEGAPQDHDNVRWLGNELGNDEYADLLKKADVLLLPYCPDAFHYRTSSILAEAFSLGKPVIAVAGSWLSDQVIRTGTGWIMKDLTVSALDEVLTKIDETSLAEMRSGSHEATQGWLRDNSIENFVGAIIHSEKREQKLDSYRLLSFMHELRSHGREGNRTRDRRDETIQMMKEELRNRLPEPFKSTLRPLVNKLRQFRRSQVPSSPKQASVETSRSGEDFSNGMSREKKARLDEAELVRSCLTEVIQGAEASPLCIDVGAHHGTSAKPLLLDGWKVIAFEPDEKNRGKLLSSLAEYIPESLVVEEMAVSDEEAEEVSFYRSEVSTGISGLSSFHESHASAGSVSTTTLASYARAHAIGKVDFLKIDTEGFDFHVLRGIPWDEWKPGAILCEFEDRKTIPLGYNWAEMAEFLKEKGYEIWVSEWHPIIEYGQAHDWNRVFRYPGDLANTDSWGNLLAFQSPVDDQKMESFINDHLKIYGS